MSEQNSTNSTLRRNSERRRNQQRLHTTAVNNSDDQHFEQKSQPNPVNKQKNDKEKVIQQKGNDDDDDDELTRIIKSRPKLASYTCEDLIQVMIQFIFSESTSDYYDKIISPYSRDLLIEQIFYEENENRQKIEENQNCQKSEEKQNRQKIQKKQNRQKIQKSESEESEIYNNTDYLPVGFNLDETVYVTSEQEDGLVVLEATTLLHCVIKNERHEWFDWLLSFDKINLTKKDSNGHNPLMLASYFGHTRFVKAILSHPSFNFDDILITDSYEQNALHLAILNAKSRDTVQAIAYHESLPQITRKQLILSKNIDQETPLSLSLKHSQQMACDLVVCTDGSLLDIIDNKSEIQCFDLYKEYYSNNNNA